MKKRKEKFPGLRADIEAAFTVNPRDRKRSALRLAKQLACLAMEAKYDLGSDRAAWMRAACIAYEDLP